MAQGGHNKFEPTAAQRAQVEALRAYGAPLEDICAFVTDAKGRPISVPTLRKHFKHELMVGKWKIVSTVAQTLAQSAKGSPAVYDDRNRLIKAERPPDTTAGIFICKSLGGWVDRHQVQHAGTGKDGQATEVKTVFLLPSDRKL